MNVNVSGPVRVFALIGGLAALAMGAWFFLLGGLSPSASSEPVKEIKPLYSGNTAPATTPPTKPKPAARTPVRPVQTPKPPSRTKTEPKPAPKPKPKTIANPEKLPLAVAWALARHPVVVVALYSPEARVDRISLGEARAGARRANVAFVALNVLDRRASEALTRKLGVLSAPAFFLYRRPGKLVMRIDGFADRDLVAQAAVNALPPVARGAVAPSPAAIRLEQWARQANAICTKTVAATPKLSAGASRQQFMRWAPTVLAAEKRQLTALTALSVPTVPHERARARQLLAVLRRYHASDVALFAATKRRDRVTVERLLAPHTALGERGNALARDVGATACAQLLT